MWTRQVQRRTLFPNRGPDPRRDTVDRAPAAGCYNMRQARARHFARPASLTFTVAFAHPAIPDFLPQDLRTTVNHEQEDGKGRPQVDIDPIGAGGDRTGSFR